MYRCRVMSHDGQREAPMSYLLVRHRKDAARRYRKQATQKPTPARQHTAHRYLPTTSLPRSQYCAKRASSAKKSRRVAFHMTFASELSLYMLPRYVGTTAYSDAPRGFKA